MSYTIFLTFFMLLPLSGLLFALRRSLRRLHIVLLFTLVFIAIIYAIVWDNYIVASGVKYHDPRTLMAFLVGYVPIEEYLFFIFQGLLIGLVVLWLWRRFYRAEFDHRSGEKHHDIR